MPQIGVRIKRDWSKKDDAWFAQGVCRPYRDFESWIIKRPLRPLHPVDNALAVRVWIPRSPDSNTRVRAQTIKFTHLLKIIIDCHQNLLFARSQNKSCQSRIFSVGLAGLRCDGYIVGREYFLFFRENFLERRDDDKADNHQQHP